MSDLLFFFHLGDFHYEDIGDESVGPRLEAYDEALRRGGVGDLFRRLPLAYCWDDHDVHTPAPTRIPGPPDLCGFLIA